MGKFLFFLRYLTAIVALYAFAPLSLAQSELERLPGEDLTFEGVVRIIYGLACWVTSAAVLLLVIFIVLAGIQYMRADSGEKLSKANTMLWYVLIGGIVIFAMPAIMYTVASFAGYSGLPVIPFTCRF